MMHIVRMDTVWLTVNKKCHEYRCKEVGTKMLCSYYRLAVRLRSRPFSSSISIDSFALLCDIWLSIREAENIPSLKGIRKLRMRRLEAPETRPVAAPRESPPICEEYFDIISSVTFLVLGVVGELASWIIELCRRFKLWTGATADVCDCEFVEEANGPGASSDRWPRDGTGSRVFGVGDIGVGVGDRREPEDFWERDFQ